MAILYSAIELLKAKAASQGEVRVRKDGISWKKVGKTWVPEKKVKTKIANAQEESEQGFISAVNSELGEVVDTVLSRHDVYGYAGLASRIKKEPATFPRKIFKDVVDTIKNIEGGSPGEKQYTIHQFGRAVLNLRNIHTTGPKHRLTINRVSKTGKTYRTKAPSDLPVIQASRLKIEKQKMGGWNITSALTSNNVEGMIQSGTAKVVSGEVDKKKAWILPTKAEDIKLSYRGDGMAITVKQVDQKAERTRATAKVEITIPYAYAKGFLRNQIGSVRTRNQKIFQMELLQGYKDYMESYGA